MRITHETMLTDLFERLPEARAVFNRYGLRGCGGKTGPAESIGFFARTHGVGRDQLVEEIRKVASDPGAHRCAHDELESEHPR